MKLRVAHVKLGESSELVRLFSNGKMGKWAWITGEGGNLGEVHQAADSQGYGVFFPEALDDEDDSDKWVAVRRDLVVEEGSNSDGQYFQFRTDSLGWVTLTANAEDQFNTDKEVSLQSELTIHDENPNVVIRTYNVKHG